MSVVYVSSLEVGKECLRLIKGRIPIDHIVTINPLQAQRARVSGYASFADMGIPTCHLGQYSMKDPGDLDLLCALKPELIIVNGWNRLVPRPILDLPLRGVVGLHGSAQPLPAGRGRSPVTWALVTGASQFFFHLFYLDEGVDSGDVIDTVRFDLTPVDTCGTVFAKLAIVGAQLLERNVPRILDGTAARIPQSGEATYLTKWTPEGGRIDWAMKLDSILNLVRGVTRPYSGAFADVEYGGQRITMRIWEAAPFSRDIQFDGAVGTVVHHWQGKPLIKCGDGGIMLVNEFANE
jgi:methionyl-tRNA formyltransferase